MHYLTLLGVIAFALETATCSPQPDTHIIHEKRSVHPTHWEKRSRAPRGDLVPLRIGLTQRNLHLGPQHLNDVSNPTSQNYGRHWTSESIAEFFSPTQESIESVSLWLRKAGIDSNRYSISRERHWINLIATVEEVENLLHTEYYVFEHALTSESHIGCDEYSVPGNLRDHIDLITPTLRLATNENKSRRRELVSEPKHNERRGNLPISSGTVTLRPSDCFSHTTPECIKALYSIPANKAAHDGNSLGIMAAGQSYSQADLDGFFKAYAPEIPVGTAPVIIVDNGTTIPGGQLRSETMLDLEASLPLIYPQKATLYYGTFLAFGDAIDPSVNPSGQADPNCDTGECAKHKATNVISMSWGVPEDQSDPEQRRLCMEFMKLGIQGVSVLTASGDKGVGGFGGTSCTNAFQTLFPNSCPYVTSVGGTMMKKDAELPDLEQAASVANHSFITSGGGFSSIWPRVSFQEKAVSTYLHNTPPGYASHLYNASGRAFPDVSAIADAFQVFIEGKKTVVGGTSGSAPIVASMITLINENRLAAGKRPVGFLNPTFYANPGAFKDITAGSNPGCGTDGFKTAVGWDPVTGMGTPIYPKLLDVFMALP